MLTWVCIAAIYLYLVFFLADWNIFFTDQCFHICSRSEGSYFIFINDKLLDDMPLAYKYGLYPYQFLDIYIYINVYVHVYVIIKVYIHYMQW